MQLTLTMDRQQRLLSGDCQSQKEGQVGGGGGGGKSLWTHPERLSVIAAELIDIFRLLDDRASQQLQQIQYVPVWIS